MPITAPCVTNVGRGHRLAVTALNAALPATKILLFDTFSVKHVLEQEADQGIDGQPFERSEGVVDTIHRVTGGMSLKPRADELRVLLPLIFGAAFDTNTLDPAPVCGAFGIQHDNQIGVSNFVGCKVNTAQFSSSASSQILTLSMDIVGKTHETSTAFPTGLEYSVLPPFVHKHSTLTIDEDTYKMDDFNLSVNNGLLADLFYNTAALTDIPSGTQLYQLSHTSPVDLQADLDLRALGTAAVSASVLFDNGSLSLKFDFPALQAAIETPGVGGRNAPYRHENLTWNARTDTAQVATYPGPIQITLDDTV
jgi:hypothetical protein